MLDVFYDQLTKTCSSYPSMQRLDENSSIKASEAKH